MMRMLFCILQASLADAQIHEFPHHLRDDLRKNWILTFPKKGVGSPIHPIPQPYFDCAVQFNWRGWGGTVKSVKIDDERMSTLHQNLGGIEKSIPSALEISLNPQDFP